MIEVEGIDKLKQKLTNYVNDIKLRNAMGKATMYVRDNIREETPRDTGDLRASISIEITRKSKGIQGKIYTNKEYAPYVEFGTGVKGEGTYPGALKSATLTYKDKGWAYKDESGNWIYTKGQPAKAFMYKGFKRSKKTINKIIKKELRK